MAYTDNIPQSGQTLGQTQLGINTNFATIRTVQKVDHVDYDSANQGYHKQVHFNANQSAPGIGGGVSVAYVDTVGGVSALAFQNASGSYAITGKNPSVGTNGYTCLPGGLLLQWGIIAASSAATIPVLFATSNIDFPTTCFFVNAIPIRAGTSPGSDFMVSIVTGSVSNTGFTLANIGSHSMAGWYWMAIGN